MGGGEAERLLWPAGRAGGRAGSEAGSEGEQAARRSTSIPALLELPARDAGQGPSSLPQPREAPLGLPHSTNKIKEVLDATPAPELGNGELQGAARTHSKCGGVLPKCRQLRVQWAAAAQSS